MKKVTVVVAIPLLLSMAVVRSAAGQHGADVADATPSAQRVVPHVMAPRLQPPAGATPASQAWSSVLVARPTLSSILERPTPAQDKPRNRHRNVLIGALIGGAAGAGYIYYQCSHVSDCIGEPIGGLFYVAGGMAIGAVIALLLTPVR